MGNQLIPQTHPSRHGQSSHRSPAPVDSSSLADQNVPLCFHTHLGENVQLSHDKRRARRYESFCKGICFSHRPIAVNERIFLKFAETSTSWSGVLRFGYTRIDPASLRSPDLPRYACPDLTNKAGHWAKALADRYAEVGNVLFFYLTRNGEVMYGVNGEEKGLFFSGVVTSSPLWALLDIYGNTVAVEFIMPDNSHYMVAHSPSGGVPHPIETGVTGPPSLSPTTDDHNADNLSNEPIGAPLAIRYHMNVNFSPAKLHSLCGKNVRVSMRDTHATRIQDEFCNGYVFTRRPLATGEKIVIQVLGVDRNYVGGLGFGLTSCDPSSLQPDSLPDDSDLLLDRMEYWVVNKDVCRNPNVGDELSFTLSNEGEVKYSRNGHRVSTLMYVDKTLPLWAFFDIYGNIQKLRVLGTVMPSIRPARPLSSPAAHAASPQAASNSQSPEPVLSRRTSEPSCAPQVTDTQQKLQSLSITTDGPPPLLDLSPEPPVIPDRENECTVCYERCINSALYTCGHVCMCYECAVIVKNERGALCPICRQKIKDVIKIYQT